VEVIKVHARPHNLNKFRKGVAAHGQTSFIRCQVAGDNVGRAWRNGTEIPASTKVSRGIDYRRLAKVWILVWKELIECGTGAVALIAGDVGVDDIAAEADERPVLPVQIQGDGCNVQPPLNPGFVAIVIVIARSSYARGTAQHSRNNHRGKRCDCRRGFEKSPGYHACSSFPVF
jgi:hypothetical protein